MTEPDAPDVQPILAAITGRSLCAQCIVRKTGVPAVRVDDVLVRFGHVIRATTGVAACEECGRSTVVHRLG